MTDAVTAALTRETAAFLAASPCAAWRVADMAGDASGRRFHRLHGPGTETAILMECDPAGADTHAAFLRIAATLRAAGLSAPRPIAVDGTCRLAIVGDLGPDTVAAWIVKAPQDEAVIYAAAVDLLVRLQDVAPPEGLIALDPQQGVRMLDPFFDHACAVADQARHGAVRGLMLDALRAHAPRAETLSLRDFHVENLIWRPDRQGHDRLGLVDFQDAVRAPPEYDLVSLLRDARRDVRAGLHAAMTARFATATGRDPAQVAAAAAAIGVQRNLRILGIFARLATDGGKRRYLSLMPRVRAMIREDLAHPALRDLAHALRPLLSAGPAA
ncbi:MAG: phosphotransferase [Rubellimicrobium sp.]|nr:phosphotransferase [Rubellimicrobium sp.]